MIIRHTRGTGARATPVDMVASGSCPTRWGVSASMPAIPAIRAMHVQLRGITEKHGRGVVLPFCPNWDGIAVVRHGDFEGLPVEDAEFAVVGA